jgi:hypothetical protein
MRRRDEANEGHQKGGALKERLRGVRKRKRTRQGDGAVAPFACDVVAFKMKLVEARRGRDDERS